MTGGTLTTVLIYYGAEGGSQDVLGRTQLTLYLTHSILTAKQFFLFRKKISGSFFNFKSKT